MRKKNRDTTSPKTLGSDVAAPQTADSQASLAYPARGDDEPAEAWERWNPDEVRRVKQLRDFERSSPVVLAIKAELRLLNRTLRAHFGARKKVVLILDFYGKHEVSWHGLNPKARNAIAGAIKEIYGTKPHPLSTGVRWWEWELKRAIPILQGINAHLLGGTAPNQRAVPMLNDARRDTIA